MNFTFFNIKTNIIKSNNTWECLGYIYNFTNDFFTSLRASSVMIKKQGGVYTALFFNQIDSFIGDLLVDISGVATSPSNQLISCGTIPATIWLKAETTGA
jgi:hypothetical protein